MKTSIWICLIALFVTSVQAQDLSELYRQMLPSVVKILTAESTDLGDGMVATEEGLGSGVLISNEGLILTAAHVVQTASKIKVQFATGEVIPAEVVSSVPSADIASIQLVWNPKETFGIAPIGNSDSLEIGNQIMMVGAPYGLDFSLSVGFMSGRRILKRFTNGDIRVEFLQTDASINRGNSGGPMFNMKGEVVGIASYILTESGGSQGLGFAASSKVCKALLLDKPTPWTGLETTLLSEAASKILNLPQSRGLLVQKVVPMSPASFIGLRGGEYPLEIEETTLYLGGDIILEVNGIKIRDEDSLPVIMQSMQNRATAILKVLRQGEVLELSGSLKH